MCRHPNRREPREEMLNFSVRQIRRAAPDIATREEPFGEMRRLLHLRVSMRVKVLFFGQLKDIVGLVEEPLEVPADSRLATVFEHYAGRFPKLGQMAGSI